TFWVSVNKSLKPLPATRTDAGRRMSKRRMVRRSGTGDCIEFCLRRCMNADPPNFHPKRRAPPTDWNGLGARFTDSATVCKRKKAREQTRLTRQQRGGPGGGTAKMQIWGRSHDGCTRN